MSLIDNLKNITALTLIQGSNAVLPLVIFPFTLHKVGSELYSDIVISESLALIILAVITYSFDINGTSKLAKLNLERDKNEISNIFNGVLFIRLSILLIFTILIALVNLYKKDNVSKLLLIWMLVPLSYTLQSFWFFIAIEKNKIVSIFVFFSRVLCATFVINLVQQPSDYYLVPLLIGIFYLLSALLSLRYITHSIGLKIHFVSKKYLAYLIKDGQQIFIGNISIALFRDINGIIISIITQNSTFVAIYSIAEKLTKSLQALARPLNQFYFPKAVRSLSNESRPDKKTFLIIARKTVPQIAALITLIAIITCCYLLFGKNIDKIKDYPNKNEVIEAMQIMIFAIPFGIVNFMYGTVGLNTLNKKQYYLNSIILVGTSNLLLCTGLVWFFEAKGAMVSFVLSEALLSYLIMIRFLRKNAERSRKNIIDSD